MHSIELEFQSRESLRDALLDTFAEGGLFIEGNYDITSGSPVATKVSAPGLDVGVIIEGLVQWRRVGPPSPDRTIAAGLGVRMLASEKDRFAFLLAWSHATRPDSGRTEWRYPTDIKVFVANGPRSSGRMMHGAVRDVSARGACLLVPARLSEGQTLTFDVTLDGVTQPIFARVAWSTSDRAGLDLPLDRLDERSAWGKLLSDSIGQFGRQRVFPRRVTSRYPTRPPTG